MMRTLTQVSLLSILLGGFFGTTWSGQACEADAETLCLLENRFAVRVAWRDFAGNAFSLPSADLSGSGSAVPLTDRAGYFWFSDEREQRNADLHVKVLDGCAITNHFWVFAAAPTNLEVTLEVTDTATGQIRQYFNPAGTPFSQITDTSAFATCPGSSTSDGQKSFSKGLPAGSPTVIADSPPDPGSGETSLRGATQPCSASETALCLLSSRFRVEVEWRDFQGTQGAGSSVPVADSSEIGFFWFFADANLELVVQVLDGRAVNGHFWVFSAATTDVEYTLRVTDTVSADVKTYTNPLGVSSSARLDNRAFAQIEPLIFPQMVVGPLGDGSTFDVELGLANPNDEDTQTLEIKVLDQELRAAQGIALTTVDAAGREGEPTSGPLILELAPQLGITTLIHRSEQHESAGLFQGFLMVSSVGPSAGGNSLQAPISSFAYNLRDSQGSVIDRIPVAATTSGNKFQFTATKREGVDTGIAVATPYGIASLEVEVFVPSDVGTGPPADSIVESFELSGQSSFFLEEIFGASLPAQFESLLVQVRSTPVTSIATRGTALSPLAVTALDVVAPPQSTTVQIAGKEVRRLPGN